MTFTADHGNPDQEKKPMKGVAKQDMSSACKQSKKPAPGMSGHASRGNRLAAKAPSCCG